MQPRHGVFTCSARCGTKRTYQVHAENKKHGNTMKPGFQATIALYLLKLLALGSWCDECIMIYFKTSSFSKLARILHSN